MERLCVRDGKCSFNRYPVRHQMSGLRRNSRQKRHYIHICPIPLPSRLYIIYVLCCTTLKLESFYFHSANQQTFISHPTQIKLLLCIYLSPVSHATAITALISSLKFLGQCHGGRNIQPSRCTDEHPLFLSWPFTHRARSIFRNSPCSIR